jgi:hypothetical protein
MIWNRLLCRVLTGLFTTWAVTTSAQSVGSPPLPSSVPDPLLDVAVVPQITNAPYSADGLTTVAWTLSDGTRIANKVTSRFYRDNDGRVRREQQIAGLGLLVTISDPIAGVTYVLDPAARTARQTRTTFAFRPRLGVSNPSTPLVPPPSPPGPPPVPPAAAPRVPRTPTSTGRPLTPEEQATSKAVELDRAALLSAELFRLRNREKGNLAPKTVEGLRVTGNAATTTIAAGQIGNDRPIMITDERWESPELQILIESRHHDPRTGTVEFRLTNIQRAEPSAELFTVPAGYTIIGGNR